MASIFIPAKRPTRTTISGLGAMRSVPTFMPTVIGKPITRGMGAVAALRTMDTKFTAVQPASSDGGSTAMWIIVGVAALGAVGGLVWLSTRKR